MPYRQARRGRHVELVMHFKEDPVAVPGGIVDGPTSTGWFLARRFQRIHMELRTLRMRMLFALDPIGAAGNR